MIFIDLAPGPIHSIVYSLQCPWDYYHKVKKLPCRKNILLCIVEELAGGGSVAVTGDRWQVTGDTADTWHLTPDTLYLTDNFKIFSSLFISLFFLICFAFVLLSAHVNRFSVSCIQFFLNPSTPHKNIFHRAQNKIYIYIQIVLERVYKKIVKVGRRNKITTKRNNLVYVFFFSFMNAL